jgi:hypothetical protein
MMLAWTASHFRLKDADRWLLELGAELRGLGLETDTLKTNLEWILADRLVLDGRWTEAESHYRAAATIVANARANFLPGYSRATGRMFLHDMWAAAALHGNRFEEAWMLLERGRAATDVDFAVLGQWRDVSPDSFREIKSLREDLLKAKRRLASERSSGKSAWDVTTWRQLLETLELRAVIARKEADYLRLHRPTEPTLEEVQRLLGPRSALVGWLSASQFYDQTGYNPYQSEVWAYVIRKSGPLVWRRLEERRASPTEIRLSPWEVLDRATSWPLRIESDPEMENLMRVWTARYFDPLMPSLEGIEHLIVESAWPIDVYIDGNGRFIGDRFDVTYVPSALQAVLAARRNSSRRDRSPSAGKIRSALAISGVSAPTHPTSLASLAPDEEDTNPLRVLRATTDRQTTHWTTHDCSRDWKPRSLRTSSGDDFKGARG